MSSKSRNKKQSPQSASPIPAEGPGGGAAAAAAPAEHDDQGLLGEDVIHVPKGRNRVQYALMIALLVFLCVIFLIPGAMLATFTGDGRNDPEYLAYNGPGGGRVTLTASEWQKARNGFSDVFDLPIQEFQFLKFFVGVQSRRGISDAEAARMIVLDELARDAGIVITDAELGEFLGAVQGLDAGNWKSLARNYGGASVMEANLKRVLAVRRYLDLIGQVAQVPDMKAIEERWADEHVELSFEYASLAAADLVEDAKAEAPAADVLEAWFDERPEFEKSQFFDPARFGTTIAMLRTPEGAGSLLERYPDTSGDTDEVRGETYYNSVYFTRFKRPEPAEGEEAPEVPPSPFLPIDEVRDVAEAEAPGWFAMKAWIADLTSRADAGEEIDFVAEAEGLGLDLIKFDEPATLEDLREHADLGPFVVGPVSSTQVGRVSPNPVVEERGMHVVFVNERVEPALPPFADIQDKVLDTWAEERASELALERMETIRDTFEKFEPADAGDDAGGGGVEGTEEDAEEDRRLADVDRFRAACEAIGLTVETRPWLDMSAPATEDPDASKPGHQYLVGKQRQFSELEDGEVPVAELDRQGENAYLVRLVGKREMDIARMSPGVYENYKSASAGAPSNQVRQFLTGEGLDEYYGISWLYESPAEEGEEETADAEESAE